MAHIGVPYMVADAGKCGLCPGLAHVSMTWLVHTKGKDKKPERTGGVFCLECANETWARIVAVPECASSVIIGSTGHSDEGEDE